MSQDSFQYKLMRFLNEMDFDSQKKVQVYYKVVILTVAVVYHQVQRFLMRLQIFTSSFQSVSTQPQQPWCFAISFLFQVRLHGGVNHIPNSVPNLKKIKTRRIEVNDVYLQSSQHFINILFICNLWNDVNQKTIINNSLQVQSYDGFDSYSTVKFTQTCSIMTSNYIQRLQNKNMTTTSEYTDQLRNIYNLLETNIANNQTKIQSQHKVFTDLYRIFLKHANKLATVANSINEEVLQAVNQEELIVQYYQMLSNSLLRLADCSRKVSVRLKSQVLDPLKTFNQNYQNVSQGIRKKFEQKISQLSSQDLETSRYRQSYNQACQKFQKHRQMHKKVMQKIESGNKNELQKFNLTTKKLTENITSSQKFYLSAIQKSNLQFQNLKKEFGVVGQSLSYNQDSRHSFFKKTIINSIKTFQEYAAAYEPDNVTKLEELSKKKTERVQDLQVKKLRLLIQKTINKDFKQRFVSYDQLNKSKKKRAYDEDTTHLNQHFSKIKQRQKNIIHDMVSPWFVPSNSKKKDISSQIQSQEHSLRKVKSSHVINSPSRQKSAINSRQQQNEENDLCKQKILSNISYSLYFIQILYGKVVQLTSFYCKINEDHFFFLLNAFSVITKNLDSSEIGIEFTFKMMIISQRIMLKKGVITKNTNQPIELLCHKYGKNVDKFREPKFLTKLLSYIQKRKAIKKKNTTENKGAINFAKGFLAAFTRGKMPTLNQDQQYNCLQQMIMIIANFSVPNQVILPFIKQALGKEHQSSYQYLKNIILNKKDVEQRQSLFYRKQIKQKKEQLLKKAQQTKKMGEYALKIVAQSGFLGKQDLNLRRVCKQLKDIHLQILGKLPLTTEQKWIRLIPINRDLDYIAMKQQVAENSVPSAVEEIITLDVNRSLHLHGQVLNPTILHSLLRTYAYFHKDISYCQGMNYIAGYIYIKTKNEESTYRIFQHLMQIKFKQIFVNEFEVLKMKMYQFQRLLAIFHPEISEHFKRQSISPQCYIVSWIITLFASSYQYTLESFLIDFLWQRFIIWGWPQFFRFVLWIFSLYKEDLVELTYDRALHFLGELGRSELFLSGAKKFQQKFLPSFEDPRIGVERYPVSEQLLNKFKNEYKLDL